ncbi:MAG: hypothetical protein KatS3mg091_681 [Patescibacteria group bacterium]|nr:MAG: hypothetical protein KatS3mg091_681 [Patescibacteria group bacterium]
MLIKTQAEITHKQQLNNDTILVRLDLADNLNFTAGQYIIVDIEKNNQLFKRLYSIASPETNQRQIELIIQIVPGGIGSEFFQKAKINQRFNISGPAGHFVLRKNNNNKIFLATGTGIAPIRSMLASYLPKNPKEELKLIWGMRTTESLYLIDEYKNWQKNHSNFSYNICLSREEPQDPVCFKGHLQDFINLNKSSLISNTTDFYICGNRDMTEEIKNLLISLGANPQQVYFEKF